MAMATKTILIFALVTFTTVTLQCNGFSFCDMTEDGLMSCKPAVTEPNPWDPTADCCQALSGANLTCLCSYKSSPLLPSIGIDPNLTAGLPAKCNIPAPANC
ncbi:hypothetical protein Droror1_Dr00017816 [Drosera rotundifolia]